MLRLAPTVQTAARQTSYTHKVESVPLSDGIFAYKLTVEAETAYPGSRKKPKSSKHVFEGLATKRGLNKVLKEGNPCPPKAPKGFTVLALSHEAMDRLAKDRFDHEALRGTDTPFTATQNGQFLTPCLYDSAGVFLHDMQGVPYSVGMKASYIDYPCLDNQRWDLVGVATTLMDNPDVTLLPGGGERQWYQVPESNPRHWIGDIPYYNADAGRSQCMAFVWHPPREVFIKAWKHCDMDNVQHRVKRHLFQAMIELDLLGINKFRREEI